MYRWVYLLVLVLGAGLVSGADVELSDDMTNGIVGADDEPARVRDLGVAPGVLSPGPHNAITDVEGVAVGHRTLIEHDGMRTGVTAVLPHGGNLFQEKVAAAVYTANGFGKAAGFEQVRELGNLESPILLTNTLAVGTAISAAVGWTLQQDGNQAVRSVNVVVGETNDGYLNDIRGGHVQTGHVVEAIGAAAGGAVAEGNVGAGTGTRAFGWKGGIGTASRTLPPALGGWTTGVLVQANFDGILTIDGVRVGEALGQYRLRGVLAGEDSGPETAPADHGSIMIVIATDAPVGSRNLERMARRAPLGIARTGGFMYDGTGDFVIAFSTAGRIGHADPEPVRDRPRLHNHAMDGLFLAVVEATEEAIYNALFTAQTMSGRDGRQVEALPVDQVRKLLEKRR